MKTLLLICIGGAAIGALATQFKSESANVPDRDSAKCSPEGTCSACKNCRSCGNCKTGGKCSVCK